MMPDEAGLAQVISHAHHSSDVGNTGRIRHFQNGFDLAWVRVDSLSADAVSEERNFASGKLRFVLTP